MGLVLAFQNAPRPTSRTSERRTASPRSADVLLFTGVRYERHGASPSAQPAQPSGGSDIIPSGS